MNPNHALAAIALTGVALVAMNVRDKINTRKRNDAIERYFDLGWQTFLTVHHATNDPDLAMRVANKVQTTVNL